MMLSSVMHKIQSVFHNQDMHQSLEWMDSLPAMGELDALLATRAQLAKVEFNDTQKLKDKIDVVLEIDSKTYQKVNKITHKHLISMSSDREMESEVQNTVHLYQRQLYLAYASFFYFYQNQTKAKLSDEKLNLILARFLNATFTMMKWRYFDDQPAPLGAWDYVHKVIKCAENLSIMNKNLFLYDDQVKETSIATLLKHGFMMDTLQKGNFSRLQVQLTEQVLKIWSSNPLIVNKYKQDRYHFLIALENDRGPERVRTLEKFAEYRFWKTTRLTDLIESYLCAVDTGKSLDSFGLEKIAPVSVVVKLFKKLRTEWCVEGYARQRRKEARIKNNKRLNVNYGLENIYTKLNTLQLKPAPKASDSVGFSFELKLAMHRRVDVAAQKLPNNTQNEAWWLVDESGKGLAVDLGKTVSNWVEVGKLIAYTTSDDKETFFIAEIKSLRKQADGTYRAGLALLTKAAIALKISRVQKELAADDSGAYFVDNTEFNLTHLSTFSGLLIKKAADNPGSSASLIMPRSEYKRGGQYRISVDGEDKVVVVGRILLKQRDWIQLEVPI